jgi:arylsulfatase A-like enzyme
MDAASGASRQGVAATLARAATLAAVGGGAVGLAESAKVLASADARYVQWACKLIAIGGGGYALVAAALALPCAGFALALQGRPQHRAAPASACAGLGAIAAVAAFALSARLGAWALLPIALATTSLALALRELLAWWPFVARLSTWWGLLGASASAGIALAAHHWAHGAPKWIALVLAAVGLAVAASALVGRHVPHAASFGLIALIVLAAGSHPERRIPEVSSAGRRDVLLVTVDTLRADHLGCYGDGAARTPVIDGLAREGVLFEDATAQANTTGPSHATILTGLHPAEHGALSNGVRISHRARTLADVLARTHSTAAFVSGFTLDDQACALAARFDWYDDQLLAWPWLPRIAERLHLVHALLDALERRGWDIRRPDRPAGETVDAALAWLGSRGDEPLFTWVHLYDPHAPYAPPPEFRELHGAPAAESWYELSTEEREELVADPAHVARTKALYSAEISYADAQIGRLLDALRASGRFERTLIVLTSDHGEGLGAHGYWFDHGSYLYDEELHVPLILRFPGAEHAGRRVPAQVRLLDVAPTVLDALGLQGLQETRGSSLIPLASGLPDPSERGSFALSDVSGDVSGFPIEGRRLSLRTRGHKLIWSSAHWLDTTRVPEREEYYDLARDPGELDDLKVGDQLPAAPYDDLQRALEDWRAATGALRPDQELSDEVLERLRKLGYF